MLLILRGLHDRHAVQRGISVPSEHLLQDRVKPRKALIDFAGGKALRNYTHCRPARSSSKQHLNIEFLLKAEHNTSPLQRSTD
jgi:hypothetical protein